MWQGLRSLRLPAGLRPDAGQPPLFFVHIPKTAGTSMTVMLRRMLRPRRILSDDGSLSVPFLQRAMAEGLQGYDLIHGHLRPGAGALLRGKARAITLLRDPASHAISNYLFLREEHENPDAEAARQLGFTGFIRQHPYYAVFQAGSLLTGLDPVPPRSTSEIVARLPQLQDYLEEMYLVGIVERLPGFMADLARATGYPAPRLRHLQRSETTPGLRGRLREQYEALARDPQLGPLIAAERTLYDTARAIEARRAGVIAAE